MLWAAFGTASTQKHFAVRIHEVLFTTVLCWNKNSNHTILHRLKSTKINIKSLQILISASTQADKKNNVTKFWHIYFEIPILEFFWPSEISHVDPLGFRSKPSHNNSISEYQPATRTGGYKTSSLGESLYSLLCSRTAVNSRHHSASQFSNFIFFLRWCILLFSVF